MLPLLVLLVGVNIKSLLLWVLLPGVSGVLSPNKLSKGDYTFANPKSEIFISNCSSSRLQLLIKATRSSLARDNKSRLGKCSRMLANFKSLWIMLAILKSRRPRTIYLRMISASSSKRCYLILIREERSPALHSSVIK